MRTIVQSGVQSGDGEKNVHSKFDKYKNNTLIFYKTSTRCAWSGLLTAPQRRTAGFVLKILKYIFLRCTEWGRRKKCTFQI